MTTAAIANYRNYNIRTEACWFRLDKFLWLEVVEKNAQGIPVCLTVKLANQKTFQLFDICAQQAYGSITEQTPTKILKL